MRNASNFWWRKSSEFLEPYVIEFTSSIHRFGGPWMRGFIRYEIAERTGIALHLFGSWYFFGIMKLANREELSQPTTRPSP